MQMEMVEVVFTDVSTGVAVFIFYIVLPVFFLRAGSRSPDHPRSFALSLHIPAATENECAATAAGSYWCI